MKAYKWILATGAFSMAGVVAANEKDWQAEMEREAQQTESAVERESAEAQSELQQEGEEVRASYEEEKQEARQWGDQAAEDVEDTSQGIGARVGGALDEGIDSVTGEPSELERGTLANNEEVANSLTTNPLGYFNGDGINLQYTRSLSNKISARGGANFATAEVADSNVGGLGVNLGADYYLIGGNNEGLRVGPRVSMGLGDQGTDEVDVFGRLGAGAELGYDWISSGGITAGAGVGAHADVNADDGFYGALNLGYSW